MQPNEPKQLCNILSKSHQREAAVVSFFPSWNSTPLVVTEDPGAGSKDKAAAARAGWDCERLTCRGYRAAAAGWFPRRYCAVPTATRTFVRELPRCVAMSTGVPHVCLTIPGRTRRAMSGSVLLLGKSKRFRFSIKLPCFFSLHFI